MVVDSSAPVYIGFRSLTIKTHSIVVSHEAKKQAVRDKQVS